LRIPTCLVLFVIFALKQLAEGLFVEEVLMVKILDRKRTGPVWHYDVDYTPRLEHSLKFPEHIYGILDMLEKMISVNSAHRSFPIRNRIPISIPSRPIEVGGSADTMIGHRRCSESATRAYPRSPESPVSFLV